MRGIVFVSRRALTTNCFFRLPAVCCYSGSVCLGPCGEGRRSICPTSARLQLRGDVEWWEEYLQHQVGRTSPPGLFPQEHPSLPSFALQIPYLPPLITITYFIVVTPSAIYHDQQPTRSLKFLFACFGSALSKGYDGTLQPVNIPAVRRVWPYYAPLPNRFALIYSLSFIHLLRFYLLSSSILYSQSLRIAYSSLFHRYIVHICRRAISTIHCITGACASLLADWCDTS